MGAKRPKAAPQPALTGQLAEVAAQNQYNLKRQAEMKGPSVTADALKASKEKTLASQIASAQTARTRNVGALQRTLQQQSGMQNRQVAQGSQAGRVQEAQVAQNQILGLAEGNLNRQGQMNALEAQRQAQASASKNQMTGALLGAAGTIAGGQAGGAVGGALGGLMSDTNAKENKAPAGKKVNSFLDQLNSSAKAPSKDAATDVESKFLQVIAAQAEMNQRLKKMEK